MTALLIRSRQPLKMDFLMIAFAWFYFATAVEGTTDLQRCDGAQECCFYLPVTTPQFQDCCFRHGCCPSDCSSFTDASCCYNTSSYHLGNIVARLPECCTNLVCGARLGDSPPFITTSIVPVRIPPTSGHYCGTLKFGYCVQVNGMIRNEGSEWFETPCRHCRCENGEIRCESVRPVCPPAPKPHCRPLPGDCCPTWDCTPINTGCKDELDNLHNLGDTWTDPSDPCKVWICTIDGPMPLPPKPCQPLQSPPHPLCTVVIVDCCPTWDCSTGCVDESGQHHNLGDVWTDPANPCVTLNCTYTGIQKSKFLCPSLTSPPHFSCKLKLERCCYVWLCDGPTGCVDDMGVNHNEGEVWVDPRDPCTTHVCTSSGIHSYEKQCPSPGSKPNEMCTSVIVDCCHQWNCSTAGCIDESGHHNLGDVWTDPLDPCYTLYCTPSGIQRNRSPCPDLSPRPTPSCTIQLQGCCYNWTCPISTECDDESGHHNLGDVWTDPSDSCYTLKCTLTGIQSSLISCPPLSTPPAASCQLVLQGCCYNWTCRNLGCIDENGDHHDVGEYWSHSTFPCIRFKCSETGILRLSVDCPALGSPPQPTCTEVERDCCRVWDCPSHSGCTDNDGRHRHLGETWKDLQLPCLTFFCTPLGVMNLSKICDPLPLQPNPSCRVKEVDCCDTWDCTDCPDPYSFNRVCTHYHDQCYTNSDCLPGSHCCLVAGCGKECIPVSEEKPGICPLIGLPENLQCYPPVDECQQDKNCSGTKKCCETFCGKKCTDSVNWQF